MEKFPVGTIRGPYICGIGHESARNLSYGADQGVQYAVRNLDGSWAYFIEHKTREAEAFKKADAAADCLHSGRNNRPIVDEVKPDPR